MHPQLGWHICVICGHIWAGGWLCFPSVALWFERPHNNPKGQPLALALWIPRIRTSLVCRRGVA